MSNLKRLISPGSIAIIGGGVWCEAVVRECRKAGFPGEIWPVHPKKDTVGGLPTAPSVSALPGIPDAAFVGVNREATVHVVAELSAMGCGGAVCFANGYREASAELPDGPALQDKLVEAAGDMAILGPNTYGYVNELDGAVLWPDMHGLTRQKSGVAIIGQSSNVLINITMQTRGLPLATVVSAGNQANRTMAEIGLMLLEDPRITALGLHIEGITDLPAFERLGEKARELGKPVVALKVGKSEAAQAAAISHTASLAGSDAGARALLSRLGFAQVDSVATLMETLKILHVTGGLKSPRIASASCSGGEASLMADLGEAAGIDFPPLNATQKQKLRDVLGAKIALANPLDYNTYIWGDEDALADCFAALLEGEAELGCVVLDYPRIDRFEAPDWDKVVNAIVRARAATGKPMAIVSLLNEGMPEPLAIRMIDAGIIPLCGMADALASISAAASTAKVGGQHAGQPILKVNGSCASATPAVVSEAEAKQLLSAYGVRVPQSKRAATSEEAASHAQDIRFPVVLKGEGIAHKSEAGAVVLNLMSTDEVLSAAQSMPATTFLVEEMISGGAAELLVGVVRDPAHGFVLTIGMGGILTELIADTASLLIPATADEIRSTLTQLKTFTLLNGYRGRAMADLDAVIATIESIQQFVWENADTLHEIEINPLICLPEGAVAADALIRMGGKS